MGNARMSTKYRPLLEKDLPKRVKNAVDAVMAQGGNGGMTGFSIEVPFGAKIQWEERPKFMNPHWTKITFYGYTRFEQAYAIYEGRLGKWTVDLALFSGPPETIEAAQRKPCVRTWGTSQCLTPSEEWRETPEDRKERIRKWIEEGVL